jgi:hypothetical protein
MKNIAIILGILLGWPLTGYSQRILENFKVNQFGYRPSDRKVAVIADPRLGANNQQRYSPGANLQLRNAVTGEVALEVSPTPWKQGAVHAQSGDVVWWLDFSALNTPGQYEIFDPTQQVKSFAFAIDDHIYSHVLKHAVRNFYYQRCGTPKLAQYAGEKWVDAACHLQDRACRSILAPDDPSTAKDLSGGWHDAGDYNKYTNFTYITLHNLLMAYRNYPEVFPDNYSIPESGNGIPDLLDEIRWELDWLLKMQLPDGQVLGKVSVTQFQASSPPSTDGAPRFYAPAFHSSARTFSSVMAHAHTIFKTIPQLETYADTLLQAAIRSWEWLEANPGFSSYNNQGFGSANPETSEIEQLSRQTAAAVLLFEATGQAKYRDYFDAHYQQMQPYAWGYWYPFEPVIQQLMLLYTRMPGATPQVKANILARFEQAFRSGNPELLTAVNNQEDAYRAFLKDADYVWGSNLAKAHMGLIYLDAAKYLDNASFADTGQDYLHYLLGVNPFAWCFLSNMDHLGAKKSLNEVYHNWFSYGTEFSNAKTSAKGPAPGFLSGGANQYWRPDPAFNGPRLAPPLDQPIQKAYRDWNQTWPENSWEITEPAIYYQSGLVYLLAAFASDRQPEINFVTAVPGDLPASKFVVYPNPAGAHTFFVEVPARLERMGLIAPDGRLVWESARGHQAGETVQISLDQNLPTGLYILKGWAQHTLILIERVLIGGK